MRKERAGLYWKSVHASVDNDNQQALSFVKLAGLLFQKQGLCAAHRVVTILVCLSWIRVMKIMKN